MFSITSGIVLRTAVRARLVLHRFYSASRNEILWQILYLLAAAGMSFLPACVYYVSIFGFIRGFEFGIDWIAVILAGLGVFFLPMSLLRAVLFASFEGLNPIEVIGSVFRVFRQYCFWFFIFLLYCSIFLGLIWTLSEFSPFDFIVNAVELYSSDFNTTSEKLVDGNNRCLRL